jgi:hypothetical protein
MQFVSGRAASETLVDVLSSSGALAVDKPWLD